MPRIEKTVDESAGRLNWPLLGIVFSILLAIAAYLYTYKHELHVAGRIAQLERVDRQLRDVYGPLHYLMGVSERLWIEFRQRYRPGKPYWSADPPPTDLEAREWRIWVQTVFLPLSEKMNEIALANGDLFIGGEVPEAFLALSAHIEGYRPALAKWHEGDFSQNTSVVEFPGEELKQYVEQSYKTLKEKRLELLSDI